MQQTKPVTATLFAAGVALLALPVLARAGYQFDAVGTYLAEAAALPAWADTLEKHAEERRVLQECLATLDACEGKLKGLRHVIQKAESLEPDRQLRLVNRYINQRRYRRDRRRLTPSVAEGGQAMLRNQWATLLEFMRHGGDCEDYATAKYFLLRELGFPAKDMRVVVTYDRQLRAYHAVLAIRRGDGSSWLLESDNTIKKSRQSGYRFVFAVNEDGLWDHEKQHSASTLAGRTIGR